MQRVAKSGDGLPNVVADYIISVETPAPALHFLVLDRDKPGFPASE